MKYLTPLYLSLMNAFVESSNSRVEDYDHLGELCIYKELRTLRLDGGRQTGKSQATYQFIKDWIGCGNDVIFLGHSGYYLRDVKSKIDNIPNYSNSKNKGTIYFQTIRKFISDSGYLDFRGQSLKNCLVIVDEPVENLKDINKLYLAYKENVCSITSLPLFFIIGMQ